MNEITKQNKTTKSPTVKIDPEDNSNISLSNGREYLEAINSTSDHKLNDSLDKILNFYYADKKAHSSLDNTVNSALASICELKISDPIEHILVMQIIVTNELLFKCASRANTKGQYVERVDDHIKNIAKLSKVLTGYIRALNTYRNQGQQKVKVEHVHMSSGSNAVFGDINNVKGK